MPDFEITDPNGKRYRVTAPDGATQEQVLAYAQSQFGQQQAAAPAQAAPQPQPAAPEQPAAAAPNTWGQAIKNVGEGALNFATGATGGLAGDVAGLGALIYDTTANAVIHPLSGATPSQYADPTNVRERVAQYLTYQPSDPQSLTSRALNLPGRVFAEGGQRINQFVTDKTGNPYLGDVAGALPFAAANLMGVKAALPVRGRFAGQGYAVPEVPPGTPRAVPEQTPQQVAIDKARAAGYKLAPDKAEAPVGTAVAKAAGHADLERELSVKNASVTDSLAKKALGIADARQLGPGVFNEIKAKANRPYAEIAKTGAVATDDAFRADIAKITDRSGAGSFAEDTPAAVAKLKDIYANKKGFDAGDAVAKIRQLRADASSNIKALNAPEQNALGHAQRAVADALDGQLARHLEAKGMGDLAKQYADARVQLAKLHSVEDAFEGGHVSAKELFKQKGRGVPLSGELKLVADGFEFFDRVMQEPGKIRARGPLSAVDYFLGVGGAATNPALAAAALLRPAARAAIGSELYQRSLSGGAKAAAPATRATPNALAPAAPSTLRDTRRKAG